MRSVDIAEHMGYSKPSISRAVGLLKAGEYINVDSDGSITLTESGLAVAEKIYERHTLLSNLLVQLGVSPETAAEDACKMEHAISDETVLAIKRHVEQYGQKRNPPVKPNVIKLRIWVWKRYTPSFVLKNEGVFFFVLIIVLINQMRLCKYCYENKLHINDITKCSS